VKNNTKKPTTTITGIIVGNGPSGRFTLIVIVVVGIAVGVVVGVVIGIVVGIVVGIFVGIVVRIVVEVVVLCLQILEMHSM
jgi:hypothetical protein